MGNSESNLFPEFYPPDKPWLPGPGYLEPEECPWPPEDYRCEEKDWWATFLKGYMENWNRVQIQFPNKWTPPTFDPIEGPTLFLDFKPVISAWFRKYYVREWGIPFVVKPGYGCAVFVGILGGWFMSWNYRKVLKARKLYNVPNPLSLSTTSKEFNYSWRAYQSVCEDYPGFLFLLLVGAMEYPYISSLGGLIWLLGRFIQCQAFHAGAPRKRYFGMFYLFGSFLMFSACIRGGFQRLTVWNTEIPDFYIYKPNDVPITHFSWVEKYFPEFYKVGKLK